MTPIRFLRTSGAVLTALALSLPLAAAAEIAGVSTLTAPAAERGTDLDVTVWYPAGSGGTATSLGDSIFFQGTESLRDAEVAEGPFPLILLSHGAGLGGRPEAAAWLAAPLAARGFVVAAPRHPGNTGPDRSAAETLKLWLRPADLSATLDAVASDPEFGPHLYRPAPGGAVVFSCSHLHEVTRVTGGRRFALLSFLFGEEGTRTGF